MNTKLFTPGPLSTSFLTKEAMLNDWPSRDQDFEDLTAGVIKQIGDIYRFPVTTECVLLQGPSTYAIEATLKTLVKKKDRILALSNGVYGDRMYEIAQCSGLDVDLVSIPYNQAIDEKSLAEIEFEPSRYDFVTFVHCETSTGVLNDIKAINEFASAYKLRLIVDAVSTFGALPLFAQSEFSTAIIGSANKCLEGVPGVTFACINKEQLQAAEGNSDSVSFDLHSQWHYMNQKKQWRFSPPTHVVSAFNYALEQFHKEGGQVKRKARYEENYQSLVIAMKKLGFKCLVPESIHSPIIVSYLLEPYINDFPSFYQFLKTKGLFLYPGALNKIKYFRVGCIGDITSDDIRSLTTAIEEYLTIKVGR
ncbi:aminotransferase, class V [Shewanella denitrificans OS217]|uniref:2-aminoethylphosphonate--pyruvate transaminase n=1 Tax=Shewanella denitrificans (strain OS217 / ATCC BAA-1090 / DSM 15013) TaxID=318161 RepID=Q12Q25_SHEDO|nr:2-aminoethylphosphonate--pyruvate transaminase [Shewanella denitrificans]ABE54451.1 aminotransferase, class V [Shewanella denitrificans OS217]